MTPKKTKNNYVCIRDKQLTHHETDITELKARADFKDVRIMEIKKDIEKMDTKLDQLILQSERDDFNIDNRVTKLENTQNVLKWIIGIGLTCIGTAIAVISLFLTALQ